MVRINLFCALGFSTSMLVKNMNQAAEEKGIDAQIEAHAQGQMRDCLDRTDVALLSPQLSYAKDDAEALFSTRDIPVGVIEMTDYGQMNGAAILEYALSLISD